MKRILGGVAVVFLTSCAVDPADPVAPHEVAMHTFAFEVRHGDDVVSEPRISVLDGREGKISQHVEEPSSEVLRIAFVPHGEPTADHADVAITTSCASAATERTSRVRMERGQAVVVPMCGDYRVSVRRVN